MSASRRYLDYVQPMMERLKPFLPRHPLSGAMGWAAGKEDVPRKALNAAIAAFVSVYDLNLEEAEIPEKGFTSFDEFFTRTLKTGLRPIERRAGTLISPADGRVDDCGVIEAGARLRVKDQEYDVGELIGDADHAARYAGGSFAVVYLSPRDYHRVHAPVDGSLRALRFIPGTLFPVNRLGARYVDGLFARNERVVFEQESTVYGSVTTIMVGAFGVGNIEVSFDKLLTSDWPEPNYRRYTVNSVPLRRGDELGIFHLGSTAIVLTEAQAGFAPVIEANGSVKMGEILMDAKASAT